jgi:hypothetical protein
MPKTTGIVVVAALARKRCECAAGRGNHIHPPAHQIGRQLAKAIDRQCPIRSPLDPIVQVLELALEVYFVVRPCQSIHARRGVFLEFEERLFEKVDADIARLPAGQFK